MYHFLPINYQVIVWRCSTGGVEDKKNEGIWLEREKDRVKDGHVSDNVEEDWKKKRWMIRRTEVTKRE